MIIRITETITNEYKIGIEELYDWYEGEGKDIQQWYKFDRDSLDNLMSEYVWYMKRHGDFDGDEIYSENEITDTEVDDADENYIMVKQRKEKIKRLNSIK